MAKRLGRALAVGALALTAAPLAAEEESAEEAKSDAALAQVAINVADLDRSEKYYGEVLGFVRVWQYPADAETPMPLATGLFRAVEIGLVAPGGGAGLILARLNDEPLPEGKSRYGRIVVNTAKAKALAEKAEAAGSKTRFIEIPGDNPPTLVFFNDPDGYEIELYQAPPR